MGIKVKLISCITSAALLGTAGLAFTGSDTVDKVKTQLGNLKDKIVMSTTRTH